MVPKLFMAKMREVLESAGLPLQATSFRLEGAELVPGRPAQCRYLCSFVVDDRSYQELVYCIGKRLGAEELRTEIDPWEMPNSMAYHFIVPCERVVPEDTGRETANKPSDDKSEVSNEQCGSDKDQLELARQTRLAQVACAHANLELSYRVKELEEAIKKVVSDLEPKVK